MNSPPPLTELDWQSSATRQDLDEVALPMLVVYKGGEVEECLTRVHEEFSDTFTLDDVEWLLDSKGILTHPKPTAVAPRS